MDFRNILVGLVALLNLSFGAFIFAKNRKSKTNVLFSITALSVSFWCVGMFAYRAASTVEGSIFWAEILYLSAITIPWTLITFLFNFFYREKISSILRIIFHLTPFLLSVVSLIPQFLILDVIFHAGQEKEIIFNFWPYVVYNFYIITYFSIAFILLGLQYFRVSGLRKSQVRYMFLGIFTSSVIGMLTNLVMINFHDFRLNWLGQLLTIIFVGSITYAISRYRFMDIRTLVTRSAIFAVLVAVSAAVYSLVAIFISTIFADIFKEPSFLLPGIITGILVAVGFVPLKNILQRLTDKFLFSGGYVSGQLLAKINEICSSILNLNQLLTSLTQELINAFRIDNLAVLLLDKNGRLEVSKNIGWSKEFVKFAEGKEDKLPQYFQQSREIYVIPELKVRYENGEYQPKDVKFLYGLDELNVSLIIPLFTHEALIGVVVFGSKKSGNPYSQEDLNVLNIIAGQAAIAITNTELYEEQKGFAVKLQKEVDRATAELRVANAELKKLDEAKSDFISIASHQLRTPLTVIKGYGSMIKEGSFGRVPKKIIEVVGKIYISNERLIDLVENLLNISRIESGRLEFKIQKMSLADLAKDTYEELSQKAKAKKLDYRLSLEKNLPLVNADPNRLKDVVSNLIDNSIKYTPAGKVEVIVKREGKNVLFAVEDTGSGVDPNDLPHLFQKFTRGHGAFQVHTEGVGLGLYVAKMMMDKMGGKIWAESAGLGKGSKFAFTLPVA